MAESPGKTGGAGLLARQMQKRFLRAQEMVLQKIGKTVETKDEQFEQCAIHFNKQQADGNKLRKDLRAYLTAVKVMHETSQRLSLTLQEVYEPEWEGKEELQPIIENNDLLWEDYEEKLSDQVLRTLETYLSQFPVFKTQYLQVADFRGENDHVSFNPEKRIAKRGRRLVHYNVCRQHLESLQSAKKRDETKIGKAEEEFINAQKEFEELNAQLREELPELWNSRIGCYVTIFQNMSNLRDIFYEEMSKLNQALYSVMTKLEKQHSTKVFIVKGVASDCRSLVPETGLSEATGSKDESRPHFIEDSPSPVTAAEESRKEEDTPSQGGTPNPSPSPEGSVNDSPTAPSQDTSSSESLLQVGKSDASENSKLDSPAGSMGDCVPEIQGGGLWPEGSAQPELSGDDSTGPCTDHDSNLSPSVQAPSTTPVVDDEEVTSSFQDTAPSPSPSTAQDVNSAPMPFAGEVWNSAETKASHEELPILMAADASAPSESQQSREVTMETYPTGHEASQPEVKGHDSSTEDQASDEAVPQVALSSVGALPPEDLVPGSSEASLSPEG